jgi:hypothetical protein
MTSRYPLSAVISSDGEESCMTKTPFVVATFMLSVFLGSYLASAQQPAQQSAVQQHPMTFFVTSVGMSKGADLGGLAGADAHCQAPATATGAGNHAWHAYLSTQARGNQPALNARDRIGQGPWYNAKGEQIAKDLSHLHGDTLEQARLGNNLNKLTALTEKGDIVPGLNDNPDPKDRTWAYASQHPNSNRHEMLTGSQPGGRAFTDSNDHTCGNWTSSADGNGQPVRTNTGPAAQIGLSDKNGGGNGSWNSSHPTRGCSQEDLAFSHGAGLFYCFAIN